MTLEKLQTKIPINEFQEMAYYFGIAIQPVSFNKNLETSYIDIEQFFLLATYNLKTSRTAEGFLCWLLQFGHLLSPSKIRRLIQSGQAYDSAFLGSFVEFLVINKIRPLQWKIVKPFCKKKNIEVLLLNGPIPRLPAAYFFKYGIIAPQFKFDRTKFLRPTEAIFKNCIELKSRALFGSVVNADAFSYLIKHSGSTAYQIAKATHHHKAGVFAIYADVLAAS
jgi:hypothetical protein